jgi:hypothetical protein
MTAEERDSSEDWLVDPVRRPATVLELEKRIEGAVRLAEAAETAALEIGGIALEAAEQARRAADMAERASAAMTPRRTVGSLPGEARSGAAGNGRSAAPDPRAVGGRGGPRPTVGVVASGAADAHLRQFCKRADRVLVRLHAIERTPLGVG